MRILFITTYFEPDSGAAAVRLSRLAHTLQERGHEVTVLTTMPHYPQGRIADGWRGRFSRVEDRAGLRVIRAWLYATPSTSILKRLASQVTFMFTALLRGLAVKRPDVVLIEAQPLFTSLAGMAVSRLKRAPYVLNVSDLWPEYLLAVGLMKETHPLYRLFKLLVNITQRGAAGIVSLHQPIFESIERRLGPRRNHTTIHNAVDLHRFRPGLDVRDFRKKYDLQDRRLVAFIGTFGTHIDFDVMFEAAAHFNDREDVRFVLIGTGGQREKVEERLRQSDLSNARWIGWVAHDEMPYAWAAAYIAFWAVRDHDLYRATLQSKVYEAMASGTPMVIAIEGVTTSIVEGSGSGLTVPFGDSKALIGAVQRFLDDQDFRSQCAKNARAYAEANFDPERVVDAYLEVLRASLRP